ncbi:MAG: TRAP transporter small permease [Candidatus Azotimanducaceae bacterium WSBS_2022_MAG_OTU7]
MLLEKFSLALEYGFHRLEDGALVLALVGMLVMALTQILLRNLFDSGFLWAESFLRILVLWVAILGAMVATRARNHISIDLLSRLLPVGYFVPLQIIFLLLPPFFVRLPHTTRSMFISYEYQDGTIAFAEVPVWLCQSKVMPIGFGVMALRFFYAMFVRER